MKFLFDPIWSWPWVILAAAVTLAVVIPTYRQRIAHLPAGQRRLLLALRLAAWAVLVFSLLRPAVEFTQTDPHASVILVLGDSSRSMTVKDGSAGATRREALLKALDDAKEPLEHLGKDIEIRRFDFDEELKPVDAFSPEAAGQQTAIGYILDLLPRATEGKRIAAVLMLSDGAERAIAPHDVDPRGAATRLADQQIRVDTVSFGGSALAETSLDLIAEDLEVSPTVFVKNRVVVGAKIRALGAVDREVVVRLEVEEPSGFLPGQPAKMKLAAPPRKLKIDRGQDVIPVEFEFVAETPGEFKLKLEAMPLEGEAILANNSMTTYITVLKGGISVVYFDQVRAEQKSVRRIDESPDIRLDFKPIRLGPLGPKPTIEEEWFQPGQYDVYIIGSVPAAVFGKAVLEKLARAVEQGAGLLMTGGTLSFGPGGYADTALADVLPVEMLRTERQNGDVVDPTLHYEPPLVMLPTTLGLQHFVMRLSTPDKNLERWKALQAQDGAKLDGANKFTRLKDGALVLAESAGKKYPLLMAQDFGRGRTMAFAADSTFHWYQYGFHEEHQRFWQQMVLWLAHKDQQGDESVWVKLDARRFRIGQPVGMTLGARDTEKRPVDDAQFKIEVIGPGDKRQLVTPQRAGADNIAKFLDTREPGEYRVRVEASKEGLPIGLPAEARFVVYDQDLELHNPAADFTLLEEIARITGGSSVPPEELGAHLRHLARQGLNLEVTEVKRISLWDNGIVLVLFVLALSLEWYFRKRRGLV